MLPMTWAQVGDPIQTFGKSIFWAKFWWVFVLKSGFSGFLTVWRATMMFGISFWHNSVLFSLRNALKSTLIFSKYIYSKRLIQFRGWQHWSGRCYKYRKHQLEFHKTRIMRCAWNILSHTSAHPQPQIRLAFSHEFKNTQKLARTLNSWPVLLLWAISAAQPLISGQGRRFGASVSEFCDSESWILVYLPK